MSILFNNPLLGAAGQGPSADLGDTIEQSLRFPSGQRLELNPTPANHSADVTLSYWFKRGKLGTLQVVSLLDTGSNAIPMMFQPDDTFDIQNGAGGSTTATGVYRDTGAWYHYCMNSQKAWINGVQVASGTLMNATTKNAIMFGQYGSNGRNFEGYLADAYFIDGQALDPTDFGRYQEDGVWVPKNYTGSYGTNGFHLTFDSSQTNGIGHDSSGNGNDFTASGFDTAAISSSNTDNDVDYNDTPTSNYATLNALAAVPTNFSEANLKHGNSGTGAWQQATPTIHLTSGKWYWEVVADGSASWGIGIADQRWDINANDNFIGGLAGSVGYNGANGNKHVDGTASSYGNSYTAGDIIGVALDLENNAVWFSKNGVWQASATQSEIEAGTTTNAAATGLTQESYYPVCVNSGSGSNWKWNLGQMNFIYTQPSGFNALQTNNLPEPTIKNGTQHFRALTGTGANILGIAQGTNTNGTSWNDDIDTGFTDAIWWIKDYSNSSTNWQLLCSQYDVAPTTNAVRSNASGYNAYAAPSGNSVAYCWDISDPTESGVEFISDTGTGVQRTVSHNLGRIPRMIWGHNVGVSSSNNVWCYHVGYGPNGAFNLANTNAPDARTIFWGGVDPTDTEFTVGVAGSTNPNGLKVYYWLFAEIEGFSAFGKYNGNATTDNSFVYTGFRPAFVMIKSIAAGGNWQIYDTVRDDDNPTRNFLAANSTLAQTTGFDIDILSNGFKIRASNGPNAASTGAIYSCWAENPFGGENAPPATAR